MAGFVRGGWLRLLWIFIGVLEHIDLFRDALCITIVCDHLEGDIENVKRMDNATTQLEMIHQRHCGEVDADVIGIRELTDPCVLNGVDDEGATSAFIIFVQL